MKESTIENQQARTTYMNNKYYLCITKTIIFNVTAQPKCVQKTKKYKKKQKIKQKNSKRKQMLLLL